MKNYVFHPGQVINVDPADVKFLYWSNKCRCGKPGNRLVSPATHLCEGCSFRYTVMEAAGRAEEFWEAYNALPEAFGPGIGGWVSYNVKYSAAVSPETTIRMRSIKADEAIS